jgi:hypothetical protein
MYFLTSNHTLEIRCTNFLSLSIHVGKTDWAKETRPIILEGVTLEVLMKGEVV